ncbi:MAG: HNH endonuclease [Boseongicola sp. SB0673_bin_14]|nr:HNH endonuclease [Boseongicola sp.]MYI69023.1 HNH endonuclease [Boseongicola sp. SB0673_bin_14]
MGRTSWSEEHVRWLRENYRKLHPRDIHAAFNARFGLDRPWPAIRDAAKRRGITGCKPPSIFTAEQKDWIRANFPRHRRPEACRLFAERFGATPDAAQVMRWAKANHVRSAWDGRYRQGENRGGENWRKMVAHPNSIATRFSKGRRPDNERPMFSERVQHDSATGAPYVLIKVPLPDPHRPHLHYSWIRKALWVWREAGREIPEGHAVVHRDGDTLNCELGNLDCVPRAVLIWLNAPWAPGYAGPDANPARVRIAQIGHAIARLERTAGPLSGPAADDGDRA